MDLKLILPLILDPLQEKLIGEVVGVSIGVGDLKITVKLNDDLLVGKIISLFANAKKVIMVSSKRQ